MGFGTGQIIGIECNPEMAVFGVFDLGAALVTLGGCFWTHSLTLLPDGQARADLEGNNKKLIGN